MLFFIFVDSKSNSLANLNLEVIINTINDDENTI